MLQFITHSSERYSQLAIAELVLKGGCRWVQLRMKDSSVDEVRGAAQAMKALCDSYNAKLILDDHVELAIEVGASGVHVGKQDMPIAEARAMAPDGFIIGGTANTLEDMVNCANAGADYLGVGPFRFTETKKNLSPVLGSRGYEVQMKQFRDMGYLTPVVAIGGITLTDIPELMQTGVSGMALSGFLLNAEQPEVTTQEVLRLMHTVPQR